ncbi:hypothetical protein B0H17DRAFT_1125738 [Mycena rosella]|uniref:Uncharacterized protein n=1 Tax=Mycena rosella TaxID=1033263 RepID=A0AAD7M9L8_MYCRO|nr:hypothetical protein B0H17DRAFT_1125738 [Mycena rosella]
MYYPTRHSAMQLPWYQLTTVRIGVLEFSNWLAILRDAPNLVDGIFEVQDDGDDIDYPAQPIFVPPLNYLQSLTIVGFSYSADPAVPMDVLDSLTAPALKSLDLQFPQNRAPMDTSPCLRFATRSTFQLHTLVLSFIATPTGIIQCLKVVPSLVLLKIAHLSGLNLNTIFTQLTNDFPP